ncbi:aspartate aminotransferase [Chromatiales bacterium (ex Bugula neritina AB1)]|nr:aspartate aminotransferase [Chromatiales bacterium (ex Bugula neritina AB1)]
MNYAASRLSAVRPSASMAVSGRAKALKAQGHDVIDLGLGEPDFDTPSHIIEAAYRAAVDGQTRYTPTDGSVALKDAISSKFERENGLSFRADEIIVSNGAKQVIFDALMATLEAGDEVILCAPHFDTYQSMSLVLAANLVLMPCEASAGFRVTPEQLDASISHKTRWLFLNLPSNPAGAMYSREQLAELGEVIARYPDVLVLSDEIYEHITFDNLKFTSFLAACPHLKERTLTVNGVSKAYAMTGWRIGYGCGPAGLISAMTKVQSQISSGASAISQAASVAALNGPQDDVLRFRQAFQQRRDLVVNAVEKISGLTLDPPGGAFYTLIGCERFIGSRRPDGEIIDNDVAFANYLLDDALVAAVPGSAYNLSPFVRLSTASSESLLSQAMQRIDASVAKLLTPETGE